MANVQSTPSRGPGRPVNVGLQQDILAATVDLLLERDTRDVTISAITERAGTSRTALYRRWSSREELLADALESLRTRPEIVRGATALDTIRSSYEESSSAMSGHATTLARKRIALALENEQLRTLIWERQILRHRELIATEIRRGIDSGELDPAVDVEAMIDLLSGMYYYQFVVRPDSAREESETRQRLRTAVTLVWEGASRR